MSSFAQSQAVGSRLQTALAWISPLHWYAAALSIAALAAAVILIGVGERVEAPFWGVLLLAGVAACAESRPIRVSAHAEVSVAVLPLLFAAVAYGPLEAMLIGATSMVSDFRRPHLRWVIWTSIRTLSAAMAGVAGALVLAEHVDSLERLLLAVLSAASIEALIDACLGALTVRLRGSTSYAMALRSVWRMLLAAVPLYVPVVTLLVYAYREVSVLSVLLFFAPAFAAHSFYRLYQEEREAREQLRASHEHLEAANLSFATALVATLDARDRYTAGHSAAVAFYARDIAAQLELDERTQHMAHVCGLVHDIGKIGLPLGVLDKRGELTPRERRQMERHCEIGERILRKITDYEEIASIVRHHHERVDGQGYPDGLDQDQIPLISRIISVADAYNAMTSDRPYREAMPSSAAMLRLAQGAGSQFDETVVVAFEAILASASDEYRAGARIDSRPADLCSSRLIASA